MLALAEVLNLPCSQEPKHTGSGLAARAVNARHKSHQSSSILSVLCADSHAVCLKGTSYLINCILSGSALFLAASLDCK